MVGGDDSEAGLVKKKKGKQNRQPVLVPALPQTTGIKRATTTITTTLCNN